MGGIVLDGGGYTSATSNVVGNAASLGVAFMGFAQTVGGLPRVDRARLLSPLIDREHQTTIEQLLVDLDRLAAMLTRLAGFAR